MHMPIAWRPYRRRFPVKNSRFGVHTRGSDVFIPVRNIVTPCVGAKLGILALLQHCDISGELVSESNQRIGPARPGIDIDERGRIA
jgi:hypothetical protein